MALSVGSCLRKPERIEVGIMENKNKTFVDDIERTLYDIRNETILPTNLKRGLPKM